MYILNMNYQLIKELTIIVQMNDTIIVNSFAILKMR